MPTDEPEQDRMRVLHVEDDPAFAELTAAFLERVEPAIDVESITTPEEALDRGVDDVDCVLCDYDLPEMTGIDLLACIRETNPNVPFILFTGKGSEEIASDAISVGVTNYLQKKSGASSTNCWPTESATRSNSTAPASASEGFRAIEAAAEGISHLDEAGRFTFVNEAYREMYGYDSDELLGAHWDILYREEDAQEVHEEVLPTMRETGFWRGETIGKRKNGSLIYGQHSLTERPGGGLVCTVQDITDRVEQHERLEERERALREEQAFTENIIGSLGDLLWVLDTDDRLVRWNDPVETVRGYTGEELDAKHGLEFFDSADRETIEAKVDEVYERGDARGRTRIVTKDGDTLPFELVGTRLTDADGTLLGICDVARELCE